jgi:hypothetical protein
MHRRSPPLRAPCRCHAVVASTARSPPPAVLWQAALEPPSQEPREPPSQERRHQEAKAKSFDESVREGILTGKELQEILDYLANDVDNDDALDGALAVPSGQWA